MASAAVPSRPSGTGPRDDGGESVLAVPVAALRDQGLLHQGFATGDVPAVLRLIECTGEFLDRAAAEQNPDWKQIIPYAVVASDGLVFQFRRTRKGGEPRLHSRLSIGVGGHINPDPVDRSGRVEAGLRRELEEELEDSELGTFRALAFTGSSGLGLCNASTWYARLSRPMNCAWNLSSIASSAPRSFCC